MPTEISYTDLSPEALRGVIEDFVLREGTDYGEVEYSLDQKIAEVMQLLKDNKARIYFDEELETCTILTKV